VKITPSHVISAIGEKPFSIRKGGWAGTLE